MKKLTIITAFCALILGGCAENNLDGITPEENTVTLPDLTAGFADEECTKTYVEEGKYLRWHEDDRITAFYGNTLNRQYKFKGATGDNSGTFSLVPSGELGTGNDLEAIYAIYPYDENSTITDKGEISLTLPATQLYAEKSFGRGANTMIAVTAGVEDTFLGFKNVSGYLKLKFYDIDGGELKSIEIKGNNNEKIAGAATATIALGEAPQLIMEEDATGTITIDCGDGIAVGKTPETATEIWVVIPETTFTKGLTIKVTDSEGGVFEKSTDKEVAITRNEIQPMAALEIYLSHPNTWKIHYRATEKIKPDYYTRFGAKLVSNEWNAETKEGLMLFDNKVTEIGGHAFYKCSSLTSVTIPDSVTSIGSYAFDDCSSLTSVTIPDSVTSIGSYAFDDCSSLTNVTIPDSVVSIGDDAFSDCSSLTSVHITDVAEWCGITFGDNYANPLYYAHNLYLNGVLVTDLVIPDSVTTIGNYAFSHCSSLTSVTIPDSVTKIGVQAFYNCTSLTNVTIPDSVTSIGNYAFRECSSLTSVHITDIAAWCGITFVNYYDNPLYYAHNLYLNGVLVTDLVIPDSVTEIGERAFQYCTSLTSVTIPDSVTTIGNYAFSHCSSLTSVTIPDSVTKIGVQAFSSCKSLTSVTIPDSVTSIGYAAFSNCYSLTSVTIPDSVTEIGERAFQYCTSLTSITIPDSVTSIGNWAFYQCSSLTSVTIPDSVVSIGDDAFSDCSSLTSITIPNSVTSIGNFAFNYCTSLTSITIPDSVTSIGERAFSSCKSLTSVTIPNSVTSIGDRAFDWCTSLKEVYCKPTTPPSVGASVFSYNASGRKIYVPASDDDSIINAYKSADVWSSYATYMEEYNFTE